MAQGYSKHKDRDPRQTVETVRGILEDIGLETNLRWTSHQFDGTCSNRVTVEGTTIASNGKGTTEEYAMASGYAELMERIQNKLTGQRIHVSDTYTAHGFYDFPDERVVAAADIVSRHDPVIDGWLGGWGMHTETERTQALESFSKAYYPRDDGMLAEVPYVDVFDGELRWLSLSLYRGVYASNGMAAGNTLEECLVQGLSEVYERHVIRKVLRGEVTPPRIPHEELAAWSVGELIERIEEGGRYRVLVHDGSLGKGYPVIITAIVDRFHGTLGVNCGAHPSMAVAVERTLTEAFQGKDINRFTTMTDIAPLVETAGHSNLRSVVHDGSGSYPPSFLTGTPSWEYVRWPSDEGLTNAELLDRMVGLLRRDGYRLLVRDTSFLGFPSCHILVPGMSELNDSTPEAIASSSTVGVLHDTISTFPDVTPEQQELILAAESPETRKYGHLYYGRPFTTGRMRAPRVFGMLHLARGEFGAASANFRQEGEAMEALTSLYWQAMARYAGWREEGLTHEEAIGAVQLLYLPTIACRVACDTEPGPDMLTRAFPRMNCFNCEACEMAAMGHCAAPANRVAFEKINAAMARSTLTQDRMLQLFERASGRQASLGC